jgi:hypothetical protein
VKILKFKPNPNITVDAISKEISPRKACYSWKVNLVHPKSGQLISSHIFRKNDKTVDPKEAAYQFAELVASPSVVVSDVIRIRETIY